ncbi:MAG TPA: glucose-1-phosphate cytidylyltransferase [Planctomycetes bacterium]|nr:glucose-1-phosphate cytidylyltransferase [Planctomycetota bacterium]
MKTVILCGGKGRRLEHETEYRPKPLIEIGGRPILWHIMKIYSHQGFKDFILCLGYRGNMIKEYFLNLEEMVNDFSLDLRRNKISHHSDKGGLDGKVDFIDTGLDSMTGARIARIRKYLGEEENFFVTYGDAVADIDLEALYEYHKKSGKTGTITAVKPPYKFGLVEVEGGLVKKFDEKPDMKDLVNGGYMVFNKGLFDYLSEDKSCIFEQEPLKTLAKENQLAVYEHKGFWKCMDTQKEADELNAIYERGAPWEIWQ